VTTWELVKQECVCLLRFESWELCSWRREGDEFGLEGVEEGWRGLYRLYSGDEHEIM
jgi:hypothetical protein